MTTTRVSRAAYHHGDLPNALADAATDLARSGGPEAVVLREAARRVGVSAAAAYRHFAGHGDLLLAAKLRALAALASAMQEGLDSAGPRPGPPDTAIRRFRNLGSAYVSFALSQPGLFHTAFCRVDDISAAVAATPGIGGSVAEQIEASRPYQILSESLDELVAVGLLGPARRELAPIAFWSSVHGLATLLVDGPLAGLTEHQRAGAIQKTLDVLIDGIRCPPPSA
jgi:AcrR family transcriptional regulator